MMEEDNAQEVINDSDFVQVEAQEPEKSNDDQFDMGIELPQIGLELNF